MENNGDALILFYKFLIASHLDEGVVPVSKYRKRWHVSCSARGGLEPRFRVLFSAIFHGVPSEIAIRVENGGFSRKQNCCKLLQVYVHFVCELY